MLNSTESTNNQSSTCFTPDQPIVRVFDTEAFVKKPENYPGTGLLLLWLSSEDRTETFALDGDKDIHIQDLDPGSSYELLWTYDSEVNGEECSTESLPLKFHTLRKLLKLDLPEEVELRLCPPGEEIELITGCPDGECLPAPIEILQTLCPESSIYCPPSERESRLLTFGESSTTSSLSSLSSLSSVPSTGPCLDLAPDAIIVNNPTSWGFNFQLPDLPEDADYLIVEYSLSPSGPWSIYRTNQPGLATFTTTDLNPGTTYYFRAVGVGGGYFNVGPVTLNITLYCPAVFNYSLNLELTHSGTSLNPVQKIKVHYSTNLISPDNSHVILSLERSTNLSVWTTVANNLTWDISTVFNDLSSITFDTTYYYRLCATVNGGTHTGDKVYSSPASILTYPQPSEEPDPVQFDDNYGTYLTLVAPDVLPDRCDYILVGIRDHDGVSGFADLLDPETNEIVRLYDGQRYIVRNLIPDSIYDFVYFGINRGPWKAQGDIASIRMDEYDPSSSSTGISVPNTLAPLKQLEPKLIQKTNVGITLGSHYWLSDDAHNITYLALERQDLGEITRLYTESDTYIDTEVVPLNTYFYRFKAVNNQGISYSDWTQVNLTSNDICVTWVNPGTERGACIPPILYPSYPNPSSVSQTSAINISSTTSFTSLNSVSALVDGTAGIPCVRPGSSTSSLSSSSAFTSSSSSANSSIISSSNYSSISSNSSSSISSGSLNSQNSLNPKYIYGTVILYFTVDDTNVTEVKVYAGGLLLPPAEKVQNNLWSVEWDTKGYFEGLNLLRAIAVDSSGLWAYDDTHVFIDNGPGKGIGYKEFGSKICPLDEYQYTNVHVGFDIYPLSPRISRRWWVEVYIRTVEMPDEISKLENPTQVEAAIVAIAEQNKKLQYLSLTKGAPGSADFGHPAFSQGYGINSLNPKGNKVWARFKFTPHEIVLAYKTDTEYVAKIRKISDGKFEIFCRNPAKLFTFDGNGLTLVADLSDSKYGVGIRSAADAVDAALINDKLYVVRNTRLGSAMNELFYIDLTTGESELAQVPKRFEDRQPTFVERLGNNVLWIYTDPNYPPVGSSSSSSSSVSIYARTVAYLRTPENIKEVWTLPEVITSVYADAETAGTTTDVQQTGETETEEISTQVITYAVGRDLYNALGAVKPVKVYTFGDEITALATNQVGLEDGRIFKYDGTSWYYDSTLPHSVKALSAWKGASTLLRSVAGEDSPLLYRQGEDYSWYPDRKLESPPVTVSVPASSSSNSSGVSNSSSSQSLYTYPYNVSKITVLERYSKTLTAATTDTVAVIDEKLLIGSGLDGLLFVMQRSTLNEGAGALAVTRIGVPNLYPYGLEKITSSSSRSSRLRSSSSSSTTSLISANSSSSPSSVSSSVSSTISSSTTSSSSSSSSSSSFNNTPEFLRFEMGVPKTINYTSYLVDLSSVDDWEIYWGRPGRPPYDELIASADFDAGWDVVIDRNTNSVTLTAPSDVAISDNYLLYIEETDNKSAEIRFGVID